MQSDVSRLCPLRLVLPEIALLALNPVLHFEAVAESLRNRGVLVVEGRNLQVLCTEGLPPTTPVTAEV